MLWLTGRPHEPRKLLLGGPCGEFSTRFAQNTAKCVDDKFDRMETSFVHKRIAKEVAVELLRNGSFGGIQVKSGDDNCVQRRRNERDGEQ